MKVQVSYDVPVPASLVCQMYLDALRLMLKHVMLTYWKFCDKVDKVQPDLQSLS